MRRNRIVRVEHGILSVRVAPVVRTWVRPPEQRCMGDTAMALYYFDLNANDLMVRDVEGTECANDSEAREHARVVAGELMQNRASACLTWMLAVSDSAHAPLFKL